MSQKSPRKPGIALLGIADTHIAAMMWKDALSQSGIPCMVRDGSATIGDLQGALPGPGHLEVYVPASALQRSNEILDVALLAEPEPPTATATTVFSWVWLFGFAVSIAVAIAVMLGWR